MLNLKIKTNNIFYKIFLIGFLFFVFFSSLSVLLYNRLSFVAASLSDKLKAICGCTDHLVFSHHPFIFSSLYLIGAGAIFSFCFVLFKIFKLKRTTNRFINFNLRNKKKFISKKLATASSSLNLEKRIMEINDRNPVVFCFGLIKPKICISSAFVKKLNEKELMAVLLHEQYHIITHENIKIFIIKIIATVLFFVPGLKALSEEYFMLSELSADEWSIDNSEDKTFLAGAIYKILELKESATLEDGLAIASFGHITEERVARMTDDNYHFNLQILKPRLLISISFLSFIFLLFIFFIYSSKTTLASHNVRSCLSGHVSAHEGCQMLSDGSICKMYEGNTQPTGMACSEVSYSVLE
ncbi:MAG: M56 family metallopeptidase [bacterium]